MKKVLNIVSVVFFTIGLVNMQAGSSVSRYIDFYGHSLHVNYDQQLAIFQLTGLSQKDITSSLNKFRNSNLSRSTVKISQYVRDYKLDDLATVILIDKYAKQIYQQESTNERVLIKYLLLKDLGFDVILTKTGQQLNCLGNLAFTPGRYVYIKFNNKVYKDLNFKKRINEGKHLIYKDDLITKKAIKHSKTKVPAIDAILAKKQIAFSFDKQVHTLEAVSNQSILDYFNDMPLFKVSDNFTAIDVSKELNNTVMHYLKEQVSGMDKVSATQFLLAFVQQVTPYGSDYDKYGEENYYYPEATIMSTTADCEDKAILLAYLCQKLVGIESVALYFEHDAHLSLGISIPEYAPAGAFKYAGKTYVSCEPTAQYPVLTQSQFDLNRVTEVIPL